MCQNKNYSFENNGRRCYVDSLNKAEQDIMTGMLIFAFVYIMSAVILMLVMHFVSNRINYAYYLICEKIYNWIIFVSYVIVVVLLIGAVMFYTFGLILPNMHWSVWLIMILIQFSLYISFIDIHYFAIFKYSRNAFIGIIRSNRCCKICNKTTKLNLNNEDIVTRESVISVKAMDSKTSISETYEEFVQ